VAACGPGSPGDDAGASGGEGSTSEAGSTGAVTTDAVTTGSTGESWEEPPDCGMLQLPGEPADLAQTPRADRDAEVLALGVEPALAVAPQARYEVVRADLAAIRAIDPPLADVHVAPAWTDSLAFWFWDYDFELMRAMQDGQYRAWECHNARYGAGTPWQIDGLAFMVTFDGLYGEAVRDAYAALPGLGEGDEVHLTSSCFLAECEEAGSITLTATLDAEGALDVRDYRFESTEGDVTVYRVTPGDAPVLL
jgi:hypothetical protein